MSSTFQFFIFTNHQIKKFTIPKLIKMNNILKFEFEDTKQPMSITIDHKILKILKF
jgi:hypothetical protein